MSFVKPTGIERRTVVTELRVGAGDEFALIGYAAMYNSWSKNLGGFREILKPGTFSRSVRNGADVHCLFNHNSDFVLGRTKSGTLTLQDTEKGLRFRCQLDKNQQKHRDLYASVQRGDVDECSFAFTVPEGGQQWTEGPDPEDSSKRIALRTVTDVDLIDVSPVTFAAYSETSVGARSRLASPDYGTTADNFKYAVKIFRRAARAMAGARIRKAARELPYPDPYDYACLEQHYAVISELATCACALNETVDDILSQWPEEEDNSRARREDPYPADYQSGCRNFRAAHGRSLAALRCADEALAATREHLRQFIYKKKS
jgi:hypothetical protein